jgi:hypothetical protein
MRPLFSVRAHLSSWSKSEERRQQQTHPCVVEILFMTRVRSARMTYTQRRAVSFQVSSVATSRLIEFYLISRVPVPDFDFPRRRRRRRRVLISRRRVSD